MRGEMTKIPKDFQVTESHRAYCAEKWGYPKLADVLLTDFIECFESNGKKHKNWDTTFKAYIRNNSPEGRFYIPAHWERSVQRAKVLEGRDRPRRTPVYSPVYLPEQPASVQVVDAARAKLKSLLA